MSTQPTNPAQMPFYGRRFQVSVVVPQASGDQEIITVASESFEPEALRVTFDIYQRAYQIYWYADIVIYNLDQATTSKLLGAQLQFLQVVVQAGYQHGAYGTIWSGPVFQPLFEREGVTDNKLTLHCILGLHELTRNYVNKTFAAGIQQLDLVMEIAKNSFNPIPVNSSGISTSLSKAKSGKAITVFGNPSDYFTQVAKANNMSWWLDSKGLKMGFPGDGGEPQISVTPQLTFAPPVLPSPNTAGPVPAPKADGIIVGTPVQTQYGVSFRVLLDPRLQVSYPFMRVKLDFSQIRRQKLVLDPNQSGPAKLTLLDADGTYIVAGVRFSGDTRGSEWYADVDGYSDTLGKMALLQAIQSLNINQ